MQYLNKTLLGAMLATAALTAQAAEYTLDAAHTNARFSIDHFATSTNHGGFYNLTGTLSFDPKKQTGAIDLTIPMSTLNSGNAAFDEHLKSADLFHVEQYPEMRFVSEKWHFSGDKVTAVEGQLTLLGKTQPVTLHATKFNCYNSLMLHTEVCGGDFETTIDRTRWGMDYLVKMGVSKEVKLNIQIEAARK
ncbi:MAG: YceI family protein [Neisseria sp.]|nr:YceI family protein [Neisseria sp.]